MSSVASHLPPSPPGGPPASFLPISIEGPQSVSIAESTTERRRPRTGRTRNVLKRPRSSVFLGDEILQRPMRPPSLNPDGTRPWIRGRSWNTFEVSSPAQGLIEVATRLFGGWRQRRNSDPTLQFPPPHTPTHPSALTPTSTPISPLALTLSPESASPLAGVPITLPTHTNTLYAPGPPSYYGHERPRILFYDKDEPYYGFTNFSNHPVKYDQRIYPTSEHLFQSFKFTHRPKLAEHIRTCSFRPAVAFSEARRFAPEVRPDWGSDNIRSMEAAIYHKFKQHKDLMRELLATGNAELIENSDKDAFWGCGADGKGRNELGKALERLRDHLREEKRR